jgi:hypothetical protein
MRGVHEERVKPLRFSRIGLVGIAALLGLATLACGGDDDEGGDGGGGSNGDREKLIESLSGSAAEDGEFSEEEAECMVPGMVDAIGVERLMEAGAADNPDADFEELGIDVTDEEAGELFDAMNECVDLREKFVAGMTEGGDATEEQAQCLSGAIDDDTFKTLIVTSLVEGEEALNENAELTTAVQEAAVECMTAG